MEFEVKQKLSRFKKLKRKFRIENNENWLTELIELDRYLAIKIIDWNITYGKH